MLPIHVAASIFKNSERVLRTLEEDPDQKMQPGGVPHCALGPASFASKAGVLAVGDKDQCHHLVLAQWLIRHRGANR